MGPVVELGRRAKAASRVLATAPTLAKNGALLTAADLLVERAGEIRAANDLDLDSARAAGMAQGPLDRLRLTDARLRAMADGLRTVAALADPIGDVLDGWRRPNGLEISRVRVPLGVVAIIYENRPNVTSDAAGLCVKSGNAVLLRGSSTALRSNIVITEVLRDALAKHALPEDAVILVEDTAHETATAVMQLTEYVDCLIPRGGPSLIQSVREHAKVPVIIDGDGNCHVYVDASADLDDALNIVVNAKTQRPSVCNAAESLVVHADIADVFVPRVADVLHEQGVELVGDPEARRRSPHIGPAQDADFGREFLDLKLSIAIAPDLDAAIAHVNRYGTGHTEAILTRELEAARRFTAEVDAAAVVVNASTRFTDGEEFGFGAEIGISTQKLHARGPMGLRELTTYKYLVWGEGQVRG
ncbi:MAG TPA: glutamate-5-semialdehyde dehydrogenase [Acidimicrobiia bacterium]|nr:glutamate-5-semialdehyde dehydrogenase [Acidimicrobiia bacterium]